MTTIDRQAPITPGTFARLAEELARWAERAGGAVQYVRGWTSRHGGWSGPCAESHYRLASGRSLCGLYVGRRRLPGAEPEENLVVCPVCARLRGAVWG